MFIYKKDLNDFILYWKIILNYKNFKWFYGTKEEKDELLDIMKDNIYKLEIKENSYCVFSDPNDVARMESRTFICSKNESDAGITNNWHEPNDMFYNILFSKLKNVMKNRTMYIVPFAMGNNENTLYGIQITDQPYVCLSLSIMCRLGRNILDKMDKFIPCIHTSGNHPENLKWGCCDEKYITHFPDGIDKDLNSSYIISYGSSYGGNALLNKKCFGLRIASKIAYNEGWLAEHCLILRIISPTGEIKHILGAFPSSCGKTNLAMIEPNEELKKLGWKFETIGDDIAWIYPKNGSLYAFNPENGFFGVSNGTNEKTNNNAIKMLEKDCIFTNCAVYFNDDNKLDVWWEGKTKEPPNKFLNWKEEENILPASHPNARYTCPITNCPILSKDYEKMVKIDAIMFGGRRSDTIPLISKAENIYKGIFYGASLSSEQTSANSEAVIGNIRFDPMAMKPFIGYDINDYFKHWIDVIEKLENPPDFYLVNWFRKENNKFLWKGFNENSLILKWIFRNSNYRNLKSSFGFHPPKEKLNLTTEEWNKLFYTDNEKKEIHKNNIKEFFDKLKNVPNKLYNVINTI
jgi:phosphoenolpyruvate carboxykinase (GTP)